MSVSNTHFGKERIGQMLAACHSIFFIGIGGVNMSSLAEISSLRGFRVGGSDRTRTAVTERLEREGLAVFYGHDAKNVEDYDAVVYTVAISEDNPEYMRAKERGVPCISRADYLGYLMTGYERRIGICGMHGKSTCTSMCAQVFMDAEVDPTVLSGAAMKSMGGASRVGGREHFIFEACEYMDSFLDFYPTVAIILNVEMDHVDYFKSMEHIYRSFGQFAAKTGENGVVIANGDDGNVRRSLAGFAGKVLWFSRRDASADFFAEDVSFSHGRASFDLVANGEKVCRVSLSVTGEHNVYNALAAAAAAYISGISGEDIAKGLANFRGAERRMEYKGKFSGADVYDDYGHHPTEVATTLAGAAQMGYRKLLCVFQSHTYSRTIGLFEEFKGAFTSADEAIIADIYAAREVDTGVVSAGKLADALPNGKYVGDLSAIVQYLRDTVTPEDLVIVMGAGDIYKIFPLMGL